MKITIRIFLFLFLSICFSCEEQGFFVKCPDCTADEPLNTELEIKFSNNLYGAEFLLTVYEGNLEDNVLYKSYNVSGISTLVPVSVNKKYTVVASYNVNGDYYIAVDSATPRVRYDKSQCENPCYFVYDKICDLRLKYTR
jgi:hypothetical protein